MKTCPHCGRQIPDDANYCPYPNCGRPIRPPLLSWIARHTGELVAVIVVGGLLVLVMALVVWLVTSLWPFRTATPQVIPVETPIEAGAGGATIASKPPTQTPLPLTPTPSTPTPTSTPLPPTSTPTPTSIPTPQSQQIDFPNPSRLSE